MAEEVAKTSAPAETTPPATTEVVQLTPYQRRKQAKADAARKREERRAARAAREATGKTAPADESAPPAPKPEPPFDEAKYRRRLAVFLHLPWWLFALVAGLFGYEAPKLSDELAKEHAEEWLAYAEEFRWFRVTVTWVAAPVLLLKDFFGLLKRKDATK